MNRESYQQVKEIFQDVLDIPPDSRDDYLDDRCSDNVAIRREVERLLNSYDSGYLEHPAIENVAEAVVGDQLEVGHEIAHYKIVEKIGAGGMGEVYLAEDNKRAERRSAVLEQVELGEDDQRREESN